MKTQTLHFHFLVESDFLVNTARQMHWFEDNETLANEMLQSFNGITEEQIQKILNGDSTITGWSVCEDKDCTQCKGLVRSHYVEQADENFKREINSRIEWLSKSMYKIGQYHISQSRIDEYLECVFEFHRKQRSEVEYLENEIQEFKKAIWLSYGMLVPSLERLPRTEREKDFFDKVNGYLDWAENEIKISLAEFRPLHELETILRDKISIKKTIEPISRNEKRAFGCVILAVPNPNQNYKIVEVNLEKAHLINYIQARDRGEKSINFTNSLDIEKNQILKRIENINKEMGRAHTKLMRSMGLNHSESGYYEPDTLEHFVNEAVQYCIIDNVCSFNKEISIPNKIRLELIGKSHNLAKIYYDDKLQEKEHKIR